MGQPRLDPASAADPDKLAAAIDQLLVSDPDWRTHSQAVREAQEQLRPLCPPDAWGAYLAVEEATNQRLAHALERVARWAFEAGREGT